MNHPSQSRSRRPLPIREGDKFKSSNGQLWTVFDCMGFGRGYWVHSEDRRYQTVYRYAELQGMERVS